MCGSERRLILKVVKKPLNKILEVLLVLIYLFYSRREFILADNLSTRSSFTHGLIRNLSMPS